MVILLFCSPFPLAAFTLGRRRIENEILGRIRTEQPFSALLKTQASFFEGGSRARTDHEPKVLL